MKIVRGTHRALARRMLTHPFLSRCLAVACAVLVPKAAFAEAGPAPPACRADLWPVGGFAGVDVHVPSNAPAIALLVDAASTYTLSADPIGDVTFSEANDTRFPSNHLLLPSGPLPEGRAALTSMISCGPISRTDSSTTAIVVTGAAPLPTTIGTVESADATRTRIALAEELRPFLDVANITITLQSAGSTPYHFSDEVYGRIAHDARYLDVQFTTTGAPSVPFDGVYYAESLRLYAAANGDCEGKDGIVSIPMTISAHVAGSSTDPAPVMTTIHVDCDAAHAELAEETSRPPTTAVGDASADEATAPATGVPSESDGCSFAKSNSGGVVPGLALVSLTLCGAALVRRRQERRDVKG